ncbi:hypothetical protein GCM10019059_44340 [Camelimonas fluminis]|nr:hypothetical protein GCM10019059_44340 [Camelimonas fluminis]
MDAPNACSWSPWQPELAQAPGAVRMVTSNADKRRDVLAMMEARPELSDREISRRCGVSPQTVSNWRAKTRSRPEERNAA